MGLDSDLAKLPACVKDTENPIRIFNSAIINSTIDVAACYKLNLAFYLADGLRGLEALALTMQQIPPEIPVIIDCKVGDIGSTMQGYVQAFFDRFQADAITINPLMGRDVVQPLLDREDSFAFALVLTSNPSAKDFLMQDGLAEKISSWMQDFSPHRLGAVIGATRSEDLKRMRNLLPDRIFLIPGIGAQGGDLQAVLRDAIADKANPLVLINSSRGIIFAGAGEDFADCARLEGEKLHRQIRELL